jgi:polar amino acid transport system permease protein
MCSNNPVLNFLCWIVTIKGTFSWPTVGSYLFRDFIFQAISITIGLSVLAQFLGSVIGLVLYFMRRSRFPLLGWIANGYIWIFRGTPLILQILLAYEGMAQIGLARVLIPYTFYVGQIPVYPDSLLAALAALSFNEGAYMAEIVRAGIDSIDVGQMEAAKSLGMTYFMAMRRVVLPQAARVIVPPLGNEFNSMLKSTSLASVAALSELLKTTGGIADSTGKYLELYTVAAIWYLAMTTVWGLIQAWIERRLNVSFLEPGTPSGGYLSRMFGFGGRERQPVGAQAEPVAGVLGDHPR